MAGHVLVRDTDRENKKSPKRCEKWLTNFKTMRIKYWTYSGVKLDGTFENDPNNNEGSVHVNPRMDTSGNHHYNTRSTRASGLWMSISTGRLSDGTVQGITLFFDDEPEMRQFEQTREYST